LPRAERSHTGEERQLFSLPVALRAEKKWGKGTGKKKRALVLSKLTGKRADEKKT